MRTLKNIIIGCILFVCIISNIESQEKNDSSNPKENDLNIGFIFNVNNILLEVESYQAGIGMKIGDNTIAVRGLLDLYYIHSSALFSFDIGASLEYHFFQGIISPYLGGFIKAGFTSIHNEIDTDNWTHNYSIPISAGPLLGVEIFPFPFLSVFAEYNIEFQFSINIDQSGSGNTVTQTNNFDFLIDSKIGNNSKLGIVVYFSKIGGIDPLENNK